MKTQLKGSKKRCQELTGLDKHKVASILTRLVDTTGAFITDKDQWMPCGPTKPQEARLGNRINMIDEDNRVRLVNWWLSIPANTPNWDIASKCTIASKKGLILIEAKAHTKEMIAAEARKSKPKSEHGQQNEERIRLAIEQANSGLKSILPGEWNFSITTHYQLSNRFAWSWKLARLGIPVVLVYLGFLNASDMPDPFDNAKSWEQCIKDHCKGIVPEMAWENRFDVNGTPLWCFIRSMDEAFNIIK